MDRISVAVDITGEVQVATAAVEERITLHACQTSTPRGYIHLQNPLK
jgi:hypothetical protein